MRNRNSLPPITFPTSHFSLLTYFLFLLLTFHFSLLTSRFSFLASHFPLLSSYFSFLASRFSLLALYFSFLSSRFSLLASHFSFLAFQSRGRILRAKKESIYLNFTYTQKTYNRIFLSSPVSGIFGILIGS